jgi:SAM-dependent methyltransferase
VIDYSHVTETPGDKVTREALDMLWTRYAFAEPFVTGKDALEVACGAGQGLRFLRAAARRIVGGDYTASLLHVARKSTEGHVPLVQLDGQALPFADRTFDVVLLYEAIYYLAQPDVFVREARRLLRPGGVLIICSANPERPDFNPSPHSVKYLKASELTGILSRHGFRATVLGAFPVPREGSSALIGALKRTAGRLHLIPKSMKGKEWLKRLFLGPLQPFPAEVDRNTGTFHQPTPLTDIAAGYKVVYAVGVAD